MGRGKLELMYWSIGGSSDNIWTSHYGCSLTSFPLKRGEERFHVLSGGDGSSLYIKQLTIVTVLNKLVAPDNKRSPSEIVVTMDLLDKFRVDEKEN